MPDAHAAEQRDPGEVAVLADAVAPSLRFTVTERDMALYRELSGDVNPLHTDPAFAAARGFRGPVVFGGLLVSAVSRLLGNRLPGPGCIWHSLNLRFRTPLYVDEPATLSATVTLSNQALGVLRLALRIETEDRLIADGTVQAGLAEIDRP